MQLIPRYLVKNRTIIISNEDASVPGFVTEYRPVYSRQIQVYKGISNVLEFLVLNADQKPVDITILTPKFQAFDESKSLVIQHTGEKVPSLKGLFKVVITENDLLNIKGQFLSYSIHLDDEEGPNIITYSDSHFGNNGTINISNEAYPGPKESKIATFPDIGAADGRGDDGFWYTSAVYADPGLNGNEALHTAVIYTNEYVGTITVQVTLDNQIEDTSSNNWTDIASISFDGTETEPASINFNGVFTYVRFKASDNPADKIIKILVRN
jgi:hypothetical protein